MTNNRDTTLEGDVVLVHYQDKPAFYARIEAIEPDIKKDWYQVTLLLLTLPAQTVTWILREAYINGDSFTMGGKPMSLEKVKRVVAQKEMEKESRPAGKKKTGKSKKVVPFKKK